MKIIVLVLFLFALLALCFFSSNHYKNFIGDLKGYGGCQNCHATWDWTTGHTIWYSENMGMFPLCENCFQKLPISKIKFHIKKHIASSTCSYEDPDKIFVQAMRSVCLDKSKSILTYDDFEECKEFLK